MPACSRTLHCTAPHRHLHPAGGSFCFYHRTPVPAPSHTLDAENNHKAKARPMSINGRNTSSCCPPLICTPPTCARFRPASQPASHARPGTKTKTSQPLIRRHLDMNLPCRCPPHAAPHHLCNQSRRYQRFAVVDEWAVHASRRPRLTFRIVRYRLPSPAPLIKCQPQDVYMCKIT